MGHTNETANVKLSQFLGTDKPAWLVDYNGDMAKIDAYIYAIKVKADANEDAIASVSGRVTTVENDITNTITPALTSAQNNIATLQGNITTINSLIGNGTPTTTDHTLIGAINEINAKVYSGVASVTADGVKTYSQLLTELFNLIPNDPPIDSVLEYISGTDHHIYKVDRIVPGTSYRYSKTTSGSNVIECNEIVIKSTGAYTGTVASGSSVTTTDMSSNVATSGITINVRY